MLNPCIFKIQTYSYTPSKKVVTLEERKENFRLKLVKWWNDQTQNIKKEYPKWLRDDWFNYWTELANDNGRKMRFEMEKTWNTGRRLATAKRTIYAKDPRWKEVQSYTPPKKKEIDYGNIDYSKFKNDRTSEVTTLGERIKKQFER